MSREIKSDFSNLKDFIAKYNLRELSTNAEFINILSKQHKKFYSYLTGIAELSSLYHDKSINPLIAEKQINYILESCSDIGCSLFEMVHGAYKASKMMLRSSIETFLKGFNLDDIPNLDQEKSIFKVFEKVKVLPFFLTEPQNKIFGKIHSVYKVLCQDTHTATTINMLQITALKYFPTFNLNEAEKVSKYLIELVSLYNSLICIKYNNHFHRMHHRNKENIIKNIPKKFRALIQGIK